MKKLLPVILIFFFLPFNTVEAKELSQKEIYDKRMNLYKKTESITGIPWYYVAAIDQFERSIRYVRKDLPKPNGITGYYVSPEQWAGPLNPNPNDTNPIRIAFFNGIGMDGNGDGKADNHNGEDHLFTLAKYLSQYGINDQAFRIAIWDYYKRDQTVRSIMTNAKVYRKFNRIDLDEKAFPVPKGYNYTYKNTWGDRRGWGGRRIHEGTDIFAGYGAPVRAVGYGVV